MKKARRSLSSGQRNEEEKLYAIRQIASGTLGERQELPSHQERFARIAGLSILASNDYSKALLKIRKLLHAAYPGDEKKYMQDLQDMSLAISTQVTLRLPLMMIAYERECDLAEEVCYWWLEGNLAVMCEKCNWYIESNPMDFA